MNSDEFKVLSQKLDSLQDTVNQTNIDLGIDRDDIQHLALRVGGVENQMEELRKVVNSLPQRTQDKVAEVAAPIISEAQDLRQEIRSKRTILLEPTKTLWQRIKSLFKRGGV